MKIFWCVLEELNSDGEDPDLESEEIYFEDAQSLQNFYQSSNIETICSFCEKWICKKTFHTHVSTVSLKM